MTNDSDTLITHTVNTHSIKHNCLTCKSGFPSKSEWVEHSRIYHGFKYNEAESSKKEINCYDCESKFSNKFQLGEHKKLKHYKQRLCSYYHGNGWGCRFPSTCVNIHQENITPTLTSDTRGKIWCRDGDSCLYFKRKSCHFKHILVPLESSAISLEPNSEIEIPPLERKICQQCGYVTNTDTEFKCHAETIHGARNKDYRGITATSAAKYPIGHAKWAANKNGNVHKCKECDSEFNIESMLIAHTDRIHNTNFSHTCSQCAKLFHAQEEVTKHISINHKENTDIENALNNISQQMGKLSDRINSIEQASLTNFPNLGQQLQRK